MGGRRPEELSIARKWMHEPISDFPPFVSFCPIAGLLHHDFITMIEWKEGWMDPRKEMFAKRSVKLIFLLKHDYLVISEPAVDRRMSFVNRRHLLSCFFPWIFMDGEGVPRKGHCHPSSIYPSFSVPPQVIIGRILCSPIRFSRLRWGRPNQETKGINAISISHHLLSTLVMTM